jgi:hypothetical protein
MSPTIKKVTNPSPSEIDDIFTRKAGAVTPKTNSGLKQKKRKKKTTKTQLAEPKRPAPEIILDPSTQKSTPKTISHDRLVPPRKRQKVVETKSDQDKFRDSRGTGPRERISCPCHELPLSSTP